MPSKVNKNKEIKSNSDVYEVYLGTFIDNAFTWYSVAKYKDLTTAYKEFKKYVNTQLKYTDEELQKVWDTGRLDIELRQGSKLLNWVGIYSRKVVGLSTKEEKEVEKGKIKKKDKPKKKDSLPFKVALITTVMDMVAAYFDTGDKITGEIIESDEIKTEEYSIRVEVWPQEYEDGSMWAECKVFYEREGMTEKDTLNLIEAVESALSLKFGREAVGFMEPGEFDFFIKDNREIPE